MLVVVVGYEMIIANSARYRGTISPSARSWNNCQISRRLHMVARSTPPSISLERKEGQIETWKDWSKRNIYFPSPTDNRNTGAYVSLRGVWRSQLTNPPGEYNLFPAKIFQEEPFSRDAKDTGNEREPKHGDGSIINLFWCQNHDEYGIYGISLLLKHIVPRLAEFRGKENGCDDYRTLNEDHVCAVHRQQSGK